MVDSPSTTARKVKAPTDHLAPAKAEVEGGTATITFQDAEFEIPASLDDVDGEFLRYAADGDAYRMTSVLMSPKDWRRFKAMKPSVGDYKNIGEQIAEVYGFDSAGE